MGMATKVNALGPIIQDDLRSGLSVRAIMHKHGCSGATVSYHRRKLGMPKMAGASNRYDWALIRAAHDAEGLTHDQITARFGPNGASIAKAVIRGDLSKKPMRPKALEAVMVKNSTYHRGNLKRQLLAGGYLINCCYNTKCVLYGIVDPVWADEAITLHLDHINGVANDHRLENLRMLCPNCHSQTESFAGRNVRKAAAA